MKFKYGSYTHAKNEVTLTVSRKSVENAFGTKRSYIDTITLTGVLHAATPAALTTAINSLVTAYATNGQDAGLYLDDGSTPTSHVWSSSSATGGVRVVSGPSFPRGENAEYTTFRSYTIVLEAEYPTGLSSLESYNETVSFQGTGGASYVFIETLEGAPEKQVGSEQTTYYATQTGSAVSETGYPTPPAPIWPDDELTNLRRLTPRLVAGRPTKYEYSWEYQFASVSQLTGSPTAP